MTTLSVGKPGAGAYLRRQRKKCVFLLQAVELALTLGDPVNE